MIEQKEFALRRQQLIEQIDDNSVILLRSHDTLRRNNDADFRFRQHSDFYYLTGLNEPQSLLVLTKNQGQGTYHLFLRENNYQEELWDGERAGLSGAKEHYLADHSHDITTFIQVLPSLLKDKTKLYYLVGDDSFLDRAVPKALATLQHGIRRGIVAPELIENISPIISEMRLIKSEAEIEVMRKVSRISADAFVNVMKEVNRAKYEYELHARLLYDFYRHGCQSTAYDPIVGSGKNACILHYIENNQAVGDDDLVLIDAGGELDYYAADITRTFPARGRFTDEQRAIYSIVLASQLEAIRLIKPGCCWADLQKCIVKVITRGLCELGIIKQQNVEKAIEDEEYKRFYMHNSGHWLGLDVHDVGAYKKDGKWRDLESGMVLTVEPGIYIADCHKDVDAKWHNIGVRIEDDILVTEQGYEVLTEKAPKEIDDIEALINGRS